jgi:hypothetical protein
MLQASRVWTSQSANGLGFPALEPNSKSVVPHAKSYAALAASFLILCPVGARDLDGRFANSPLKPWFEKLSSGKGPCCSDADGSVVLDADWESKDGHYRVRIEGLWWDVPEEAVIVEPNKLGRTMVWPIYRWPLDRSLRIEIRCFMPGPAT